MTTSAIDEVTVTTPCQIWTGGCSKGGYGLSRVGGMRVYAHREALARKIGRPLNPGEMALHHCDNPPCVNPDHLYVGDHRQNMDDCQRRGRMNTSGLALGRQPGKTLGKYRVGPETCGTTVGYTRHLRRREPTCQACRDAVNAYQRERTRIRRAGSR